MQALADSGAFWALLILILGVLYLLPTIIAVIRGVDQLALVVLVNFIGGLSGIGWLAALILAFGPRRVSACAACRSARDGRAGLVTRP